jgi:hypothetical protein
MLINTKLTSDVGRITTLTPAANIALSRSVRNAKKDPKDDDG